MTPAPWLGRAVVYRCYDAAGDLLYIGSTTHLEQRIRAHHRSAVWAPRVARVRVQIAPDDLTARRMERDAIANESPRFNLHHRKPQFLWTEQDYLDVIAVLRHGHATTARTTRIRNLERQLAAVRKATA